MDNTKDTERAQRIMRMLNERMDQLKEQKREMFSRSFKTVIILFIILVLILLVFSKRDLCGFHLDENGTKLLWIMVILDIAGLVWLAVRFFIQLNLCQTSIRKLDTLLFEVSIKEDNPEVKIDEQRICEEMQRIMGVVEHSSDK